MFVTFVTFLFVVRAPPLEAATLEATEAAVLATSRAACVVEEAVVEAALMSSTQDSPTESSVFLRLPAEKIKYNIRKSCLVFLYLYELMYQQEGKMKGAFHTCASRCR